VPNKDDCNTCKWMKVRDGSEPCDGCGADLDEHSKWEPIPDAPEQKPEPYLCPLTKEYRKGQYQGIEYTDCIGERCAWWVKNSKSDYACCAILDIANSLTSVADHTGGV
jgi:hypothetical protein